MSQPNNSLFEMIVYVSYPYAIQGNTLESRNRAIKELNRIFAKLYATNPTWCFVNGLFSTYNNPDFKDSDPFKGILYASKTLLDSSSHLIIVRTPGWDYSDIVIQEGKYAYIKNLPITYLDE